MDFHSLEIVAGAGGARITTLSGTRAVKLGGHVIVGTFGPDGPTECSGLQVVRYDAESLHMEFGASFRLLDSFKELHHTPYGTIQQFLYCLCRRE